MYIWNTSDINNLVKDWENKDICFLSFFSNRTINALQKMDIYSMGSLWENRNYFFGLLKRKTNGYGNGIGKKSLKEIIKAINFIGDNFANNNGLEDNSSEELKIDKYITYIPVKLNGGNGKVSLRERNGYIEINNYLNNLGNCYENFKIKDYLNIFYENLSEVEKTIFNERLLFGKENSQKKTLEDVSENLKITGERIRQIENKIIEKIELSGTSIGKSDFGKCWIKNNLLSNGSEPYGMVNVSNTEIENFSSLFIQEIYKFLLNGANYGCVIFDNYRSILLYDKNLYIEHLLENRFKNIDELYREQRIEDIKYDKEELFIRITMPDTSLLNEYGYEYCLLNYLFYRYYISDLGGYFILPQNKKNLGALVVKEMEGISEPIHFRKLTKILLDKYPDLNWNEQKVHSALNKHCKYVGPGMFVNKNHKMKGGFIGDIAEDYLNKKNVPILYKDIEKYILENSVVEKGSIKIRIMEDKRFSVNDGYVSLSKWKNNNGEDTVESQTKKYKIGTNNIENFIYNELKNSNGLTFEELKNKGEFEDSELKEHLKKLYDKKKISYSIKSNTLIFYILNSTD